jgi:hypothetical protein
LIQDLQGWQDACVSPPIEAGIVAGDCWIVCQHVDGICAADWLAHNGRLPPAAVLEIARQTAAALAALEAQGRLHSDLGARQLILTKAGQAVLPLPGVRAILRPAEGYTRLDLLPEGYDYLAPERIAAGTPPNVASELYACGCLWWHLLCGRPPLSGGDALGKVRSAQQARIPDVRRFAPDAAQVLLDAIAACTQFDPRRRPRSLSELAGQLGPPEKAGRAALAGCLEARARPVTLRRRRARGSPQPGPDGSFALTAAAAVIVVALGIWWLGHRETKLPLNSIGGGANSAATTPPTAASSESEVASADRPSRPDDLVLSGERVKLDQLRLQPGQTVRSATGRRTRVLVPPGGIVVDCEDVRFENLDFAPALTPALGDVWPALIHLRVERAAFLGCSFQGSGMNGSPVGIDWQGTPFNARRETFPSGRLQLVDCVFHRLDGGIQVGPVGAVRLALANCLHLGTGAWIVLADLPARDEPCLIALSHCTLRGATALLEFAFTTVGLDPVGEFHIRADDCAFSPAPQGGLVIARQHDGKALFSQLRLSGQGSILSLEAPVALWQPEGRPALRLGDEEIEAAGLVRSPVVFAGENLSLPATSRVVRWQAPLASSDPPGILEKPLFLPQPD